MIDYVFLDFDFLLQTIHVLERVFGLLRTDKLLKLPDVLLFGSEHAFTLLAWALVLIAKINLILFVHLLGQKVLLFLFLELTLHF
jgi:hypothetical protein